VEIQIICTKQDRKHAFKVGSFLIQQIRKDFPHSDIILDALGPAIEFYFRVGFQVDYDLILRNTQAPEQLKVLHRLASLPTPLSTANQKLVASTFQKWRRIWYTVPMVDHRDR
jgi:hypothetical protein